MSDSGKTARPTTADDGGLVRDRRVGLLLLSVFDTIDHLNSVDMREEVASGSRPRWARDRVSA
jgi:hypothetical protein